MRVTLPGCW